MPDAFSGMDERLDALVKGTRTTPNATVGEWDGSQLPVSCNPVQPVGWLGEEDSNPRPIRSPTH